MDTEERQGAAEETVAAAAEEDGTEAATQETQVCAQESPPAAWSGARTADKLHYAATLCGMPEDALVEEWLRQKGGSDEGWAACQQARQEAARQQTTERLAEEFAALSQAVPEIQRVADVPDEVVQDALEQGIPLMDAYLRRWYAAERSAAAQRERQQQAADQSAGRLGGAFEEADPRETAFSRSFRTALA